MLRPRPVPATSRLCVFYFCNICPGFFRFHRMKDYSSRIKQKSLPFPRTLFTPYSELWARRILLTMLRPRPVPATSRLCVFYFCNICPGFFRFHRMKDYSSRIKQKSLPFPRTLFTPYSELWARRILLTMLRPRPVPATSRLCVFYFCNICPGFFRFHRMKDYSSRIKQKSLPFPRTLFTPYSELWARRILLTMLRPRPVPATSRLWFFLLL